MRGKGEEGERDVLVKAGTCPASPHINLEVLIRRVL
jgi:hypothetical protein